MTLYELEGGHAPWSRPLRGLNAILPAALRVFTIMEGR
jgi:hypothetical protein